MKKYDHAMITIHGTAIICEITFILILFLGSEEWKWQVGAMSLNIGLAIIGMVAIWIRISGVMKISNKSN